MKSRMGRMKENSDVSLARGLGWSIALICLLLTVQVFSPDLRGQAITGAIGGSVQDQT